MWSVINMQNLCNWFHRERREIWNWKYREKVSMKSCKILYLTCHLYITWLTRVMQSSRIKRRNQVSFYPISVFVQQSISFSFSNQVDLIGKRSDKIISGSKSALYNVSLADGLEFIRSMLKGGKFHVKTSVAKPPKEPCSVEMHPKPIHITACVKSSDQMA